MNMERFEPKADDKNRLQVVVRQEIGNILFRYWSGHFSPYFFLFVWCTFSRLLNSPRRVENPSGYWEPSKRVTSEECVVRVSHVCRPFGLKKSEPDLLLPWSDTSKMLPRLLPECQECFIMPSYCWTANGSSNRRKDAPWSAPVLCRKITPSNALLRFGVGCSARNRRRFGPVTEVVRYFRSRENNRAQDNRG